MRLLVTRVFFILFLLTVSIFSTHLDEKLTKTYAQHYGSEAPYGTEYGAEYGLEAAPKGPLDCGSGCEVTYNRESVADGEYVTYNNTVFGNPPSDAPYNDGSYVNDSSYVDGTYSDSGYPDGVYSGYFNIVGNVFVDTNRDRVKNVGEGNFVGARVWLFGKATRSDYADSSGNYAFYTLPPDSLYTIFLSIPSGYEATTTNPVYISIGPDATVNFGIASTASSTPTPTPTPAGPASWFQTINGDVFGKKSINGGTGTPVGQKNATWVVISQGAITNFTTENAPGVPWLVQQPYTASSTKYNYDYFFKQLNGKQNVILVNQSINLSTLVAANNNFNNVKKVLLIKGDFNIDTNFTPTNGKVAFIVSGKVSFSSTVSQFNGMIVSDGIIDTGASTTQQLKIQGMLVSYGGYTLGRRLGATPGEVITYDPGLVLDLASTLGITFFNWQEVAP